MIHILTGTYEVFDIRKHSGGRPVELDLGCGKGRFTADLAAQCPDRFVFGVDVMLGRLRKVERKAEHRHLENLQLLRANSRDLAAYQLPPNSIRRIHLLCPDPWPKERHRDKRLVSTIFLSRVWRLLEPGGVLHLATDHDPYFSDWRKLLSDFPLFREEPEAIADVAELRTDFELLWFSKGRTVPHIAYRRIDQPEIVSDC